jgi:hypothetical protein
MSMAEDMIGMIKTCTMSSAAKMHVAGSKTGAKIQSTSSKSGTTRGAMIIIVPSMTKLTNNVLLNEGIMREESKPFPMT